MAISISIEAAELLENFQWNPSDEDIIKNKEKIAEEIADVLIYCA
ncbi:MAG: MazG-like family protein, partial [Paludibacter sp.]